MAVTYQPLLKDYEVKHPATHCKITILTHDWNDKIALYQNSVKFAKKHIAKLVLVTIDIVKGRLLSKKNYSTLFELMGM